MEIQSGVIQKIDNSARFFPKFQSEAARVENCPLQPWRLWVDATERSMNGCQCRYKLRQQNGVTQEIDNSAVYIVTVKKMGGRMMEAAEDAWQTDSPHH